MSYLIILIKHNIRFYSVWSEYNKALLLIHVINLRLFSVRCHRLKIDSGVTVMSC